MVIKDTYLTIEARSEGLFKDKGSKFIALAYPVHDEEEIKGIINNLKKDYHSARHHCYAWRLGAEMNSYRINDDGEPSGTAGKPIFGQIQSNNLTNILIVVIRYFGGTLLGVSGLINAYKKAAADTINNAEVISKRVEDIVEVSFDYSSMNDIMKLIKEEKLEQIKSLFDLSCKITLAVRQSLTAGISEKLGKIEKTEIRVIGKR
jgi:uncharacterized YigZ family protein